MLAYFLKWDEYLILAICMAECNGNGVCVLPEICDCVPGYTENDCSKGENLSTVSNYCALFNINGDDKILYLGATFR